ncbi:MAG: helix-turn-helix transcriptional regulator [Bacteroidaceae bacterium]|nr:helix-turn-helix transcriptional regulator [Bacteroidaceae bacterium]MDO4802645.1 helix-turn-helix transcriptional regulator [Prevotellaceae bacterium]
MTTDKSTEIRNCTSLDELINVEYGPKGTEERNIFDAETNEFCIAQTLREERIRAGLTQQQLADLMGTKKAYISRVETGKQNLNLTTVFRLFNCLGKKVAISIM